MPAPVWPNFLMAGHHHGWPLVGGLLPTARRGLGGWAKSLLTVPTIKSQSSCSALAHDNQSTISIFGVEKIN